MAFIWRCRSRIRLRQNFEQFSSLHRLPNISNFLPLQHAFISSFVRRNPKSIKKQALPSFYFSEKIAKFESRMTKSLKPKNRIVSLKAVCDHIGPLVNSLNIQEKDPKLLQSIYWLLQNVDKINNDLKLDHSGWKPSNSLLIDQRRKPGMTKRRQDQSLEVVLCSILNDEIGVTQFERNAGLIQEIAFFAHERSQHELLKILASKLETLLVVHIDDQPSKLDLQAKHPTLPLLTNAYTLTFSAYRKEELPQQIRQKESLLWLAALFKNYWFKRRIVEFRPDLLLLKSAAWLESRVDEQNHPIAISNRLAKLYLEMLSRDIPIDGKWSMMFITNMTRIVEMNLEISNEVSTYEDLKPILRMARHISLQQSKRKHRDSHAMDEILVLHSVLDLEMRVAMAFYDKGTSLNLLSLDVISQHLDWVSDVAKGMADRGIKYLTGDNKNLISERKSYWEDLVHLSMTKASCTMITLHLLRSEHDSAIKSLHELYQRLGRIRFQNEKGIQGKEAISHHLHRVEMYKSLARSAFINVLASLRGQVRQGGKEYRNMIIQIVQIGYQSVEDGIWDMGKGYKFARSKSHSRESEGLAFDFAESCLKALNGCSPAIVRNGNVQDGVYFKMNKGDEKEHFDDYFKLLKLVIDIRSKAIQRELALILRNTTSDVSSLYDPIVQPWRKAFREVFSFEQEDIARILWSSMALCRPEDENSIGQFIETEGKDDGDSFLKILPTILNEFMVGFSLKEPCWETSEAVLKTMSDFVSSQEVRKSAQEMHERAFKKATQKNFGAIPPNKNQAGLEK